MTPADRTSDTDDATQRLARPHHDPDFLPNETSRALFSRASLQED